MRTKILAIVVLLMLVFPTHAMEQKSIEEYVNEARVSKCQERIKHYNEKLVTHPNHPYFKFMLKGWINECLKNN